VNFPLINSLMRGELRWESMERSACLYDSRVNKWTAPPTSHDISTGWFCSQLSRNTSITHLIPTFISFTRLQVRYNLTLHGDLISKDTNSESNRDVKSEPQNCFVGPRWPKISFYFHALSHLTEVGLLIFWNKKKTPSKRVNFIWIKILCL